MDRTRTSQNDCKSKKRSNTAKRKPMRFP